MATTERSAETRADAGAEAADGETRAGGDGAGGGTGGATRTVSLTVNGTEHARRVEPRMLLVHLLRDELGLTGTHIGCDTTNCGACTVLLDGVPIKSCTLFAVQAEGTEIRTVEGLEGSRGDGLHPLQEGFREEHGLQCGFCTPGMLMVGLALLEENPDPSESVIRRAISGNLCRCTGYQNIVKSVRYAAAKMKDAGSGREPKMKEGAQG